MTAIYFIIVIIFFAWFFIKMIKAQNKINLQEEQRYNRILNRK